LLRVFLGGEAGGQVQMQRPPPAFRLLMHGHDSTERGAPLKFGLTLQQDAALCWLAYSLGACRIRYTHTHAHALLFFPSHTHTLPLYYLLPPPVCVLRTCVWCW
jgi:hypothetical protein